MKKKTSTPNTEKENSIMNEQNELKPFHESILPFLRQCKLDPTSEQFRWCTKLIRATNIPKGHDQIAAALNEVMARPGAEKWFKDYEETTDGLNKQKAAAEAKSAAEQTAKDTVE